MSQKTLKLQTCIFQTEPPIYEGWLIIPELRMANTFLISLLQFSYLYFLYKANSKSIFEVEQRSIVAGQIYAIGLLQRSKDNK